MICARFTDIERDDEEVEITGDYIRVKGSPFPEVVMDGLTVARFNTGRWYVGWKWNRGQTDIKGWTTLTIVD